MKILKLLLFIICFVVLIVYSAFYLQQARNKASSSELNVHYKISDKQERLKKVLDDSVSEKISCGYGFDIFIHNAGDIDRSYSSYDAYGLLQASNNCYEYYGMEELETKEGILKCFLCYRINNDHYLLTLTPSEQHELYQKLYDIQFFKLSNLVRRWLYIDRTQGNYYPDVDKDLSKIDYIAIGSDLTVAVNDSTPENNAVIEGFCKFVKDKYHDRMLSEGEKVKRFPGVL